MHGLYLLWWVEERQMFAAVVASALAAGDLALMLIEIPTGWFADRYGHKKSLVVGSAIQVAGMLACWLGHGIPGLIAASVLVALGDAFRSGARQALLYRSCVALHQEGAFQTIEARTDALERLALVGLVLAGGAIVETFGFVAGWIAETMLCTIGLMLACAMVEPPASPHTDSPETSAGLLTMRMALLVLPAAALGAAASAGSFLVQTAGRATVTGVTAFVAAAAIAEATGSWLAIHVPSGSARAAFAEATAPRQQVVLAGVGSLLIAVALAVPAAFEVTMLALALLSGLADPLRAAAVQRLSKDEARARTASLAGVCDMALSTALLPLAGMWRRR